MLNLETVDVPSEEGSQVTFKDQAEFLKEITKPSLVPKPSAPSTAKVVFEETDADGNGLGEPLDVLGGARARRGPNAAGFSAKERAAFIESMLASGNSRDRSRSDTGTYQRKEGEEDEDEEGRSRGNSNASASYFNEAIAKEIASEQPESPDSKKIPPYIRFAAGREKRSVSDAAYAPTVVTSQRPQRRLPPVAAAGREKRSVSDAAHMKWARKQGAEDEEEDFEDYEEDTGGETAILEPAGQSRARKALDITDPQTHKPIKVDTRRSNPPAAPAAPEEPPAMTWDEFRAKEQHRQPPYPIPPPPPPFAVPVAYPGYGIAPAYPMPYPGPPMYHAHMYAAAGQPMMYVHRTPERYRWEQSLQKFVKTMDASITYYPVAPGAMPPPLGIALSAPVPPGPMHMPTKNPMVNPAFAHRGPPAVPPMHPSAMSPASHSYPPQQPRDDAKHDASRDNKKKDSRDPYSFSAFLTAKNVTIPGDDAGSRSVMMQYLNEYLTQVTPSYPKRHVRNAQRQLKMLQRRAQQDSEAAASQVDDDLDGDDDDRHNISQARTAYPKSTLHATAPPFIPLATM